jgi:glycosyltransferase involved in cell wall biosynthesis
MPERLRIAFISVMSSARWAGSEELWSRTALRLREQGHDVAASVPYWNPLAPQVEDLRRHGIRVQVWYPPQGSMLAKGWSRLARSFQWRWLRAFSPDLVVISQGGNQEGLESLRFCRQAGLPYVTILQANSEIWWPTDAAVGPMAELFGAARKIFCVAQRNLRLLERQLARPLPHAEVVINPVNLTAEPPAPWPDERDGWKFACVARLEPQYKGQDLLFEVLSLPRWRERPVELNLYGSGRGAENLRRLAEFFQLRNVHFRGHVPNVHEIWARNHLLVLPSRMEGLPLALMEAMWCERPAVVTDVGGNAEACLDGETGFVVPAPTVPLLDQTLDRAWAQRAAWPALGKAARLRAGRIVPPDPIAVFADKVVKLVPA